MRRQSGLFASPVRIVGVQGGSFRLKVFHDLSDQGQRKIVFDGRPQALKGHKLPFDSVAPVTHGGSSRPMCGNLTNDFSFLFASRKPQQVHLTRSLPTRLRCDSAHNPSRIANRQTISGDVLGHHTTRTDNGVVADEKAGKDDHARADPHVIFDDNRRRWWHRLTPFDTMLVVVEDKRVMTQVAVASDFDLFVCRNRRAVVNEGMITYRDAGTFVGYEFYRDNVAN
jgi:hypothetical protein